MASEVIHVIKDHRRDGKASTTLCGMVGKPFASAGTNRYVGPSGNFLAVLASNPTQGLTCGKCRRVAMFHREKGKSGGDERVL